MTGWTRAGSGAMIKDGRRGAAGDCHAGFRVPEVGIAHGLSSLRAAPAAVTGMTDHSALATAVAANVDGSTTPHVVVALPSYNVGHSVLEHYGSRLAPLEHRYLLCALMLGRIPGAQIVFVTCERPDERVVEHYLSLVVPDATAEARARLHVVEVPDRAAQPVAAKLLAHPELLDGIRALIGDGVGFIEPWNVDAEELAVADALGIPIRGTTPDLRQLGFKSAGRRLFAAAGVPTPYGVEGVASVAEVRAAIERIRKDRPDAAGVVVKLDDSVAGDGNVILRFATDDIDAALGGLEDWYVRDLALGGAVEELVTGVRFTSPSVSLELNPSGCVEVLATHEQVLGGDNGQVFLGCRFPADSGYAATLATYGTAIGEELLRHGAVGRVGVDFAAAQDPDGSWRVYALEMNLRKGGTTHPYCVLRNLIPGRYDAHAGAWRADADGATRSYVCNDNLLDERWMALTPSDAIAALERAELCYDRDTRVGVVPHMLPGLAIDGRIGATAIGRTADEAAELLAAFASAIDLAVAD